MRRPLRLFRPAGLIAVLVLAGFSTASAQRPHWLAFRGDMGVDSPKGDVDRLFQGNIRGEYSILGMPDWSYPVHFGLGMGWVSYPMEPAFPQEQWNYVGASFLLGLTLRDWIPLPLYLEGRLGLRRLRPMEDRKFIREAPNPGGAVPFYEEPGTAFEGVVGLDLPLGGGVYVDLAARVAGFEPTPVSLEIGGGFEPVTDGWSLGLQVGLLWFPVRAPPGPSSRYGSLGLAMGEMLLGNFIPWLGAEFWTRYKDITRISPTSWRENIQTGPVWDDNHFHINMLLHPYQGNIYFTAGRSNGFGFEKSFLFTLLGSGMWECCGESHKASMSDLFTTTLGGTALGEVLYRVSTQAYMKSGLGWRILGGVLGPARAVTYLALGSPAGLPANPEMWEHPTTPAPILLAAGVGSDGKPFVGVGTTYENPTQLRRGSRPFSHFETAIDITPSGKNLFGRAQIRGNLWPLATHQSSQVYLGLMPYQGLDYINNDAFEFGGETLGMMGVLAVGQPGNPLLAVTADGHGLFGGVQSEFAWLGRPHDVRDKERDREYDFTIGFGFGGSLVATPWRRLRAGAYLRWNRHHTLHGSNVDGYASRHTTTLLGFSLRIPRPLPSVFGNFGLGADGRFFRRTSHFDNPNAPFVPTTRARDKHFQFYLTYDTNLRPLGFFLF